MAFKYDVPMRFEAECAMKFFPRCAKCGHKHPEAYNPPLRTKHCPECGHPSSMPGKPVDVPAVATDGRARFGALMLRVGAALHRFAKGF